VQLEIHRAGGVGTSKLCQHLNKPRKEPMWDPVQMEPQDQRVTLSSVALWKVGPVKNISFVDMDFC